MIRNQDVAKQILDTINAGIEGTEYLYSALQEGNYALYETLVNDLYQLIAALQENADALKEEESELSLPAASASIKESLLRIYQYAKQDVGKALHKIEFEMLPLLEEMRGNFYFWGMVYPDKEKLQNYYEKERLQYFQNYYLEEALKTGEYRYEVSIIVIGYNKLEYTQMCVDSLLKYLPEGLSYELILLNHGSTDGTKEYFESIHPHKQLDIAVNGGGAGIVDRIAEGKYMLVVSNDVIVTANAIDNMLKCIRTDEKIAWVVPSTPNISNLQTIPLEYTTIEEMWKAAEENNVSNPYRWEQRVRLCNPIEVKRTDAFQTYTGGYFHSKIARAFPDDRKSLLYRRKGYKLILAKDAYCYHFGSITIKSEMQKMGEAQVYLKGRKDFYRAFGVDPWGKGMCYDYDLFQELPCDKVGSVRILGINCGLGSNSLKIKENLKEKVHNLDTTLCNYTMEKEYIKDLEGISDEVKFTASWEEINKCVQGKKFDYILIEDGLENQGKPKEILERVSASLNKEGYMIVKLNNEVLIQWVKEKYKPVTVVEAYGKTGNWLFWQKR